MEKKQRKKVKKPMSETESNDLDDISCLFFQKGIMGLFLLISIFSLLLRVAVSLHSYSGAGTPPKFGDFEAQRHWMEITTNLPIKDWYFNTTNNDLSYWGLDYPPLTAYQSYFHGLFLKHFDRNSVSLFTSRGYETHFGKLLMRWTVLSSDLLIFFPAVLYFVLIELRGVNILHRHCLTKLIKGWKNNNPAMMTTLACLLKCDQCDYMIERVADCYIYWTIAEVVGVASCLKVLSRLAPFERGIYEDYVANFWCSSSVLIKWKRLFTTNSLRFLSLVATILTFLPSMIQQIWSPSSKGLLYGLLNSSLAFYLFSFQVHEKSILLPLLPATLLAMELPGVLSMLLMHSALLSMFPLLCRDKMAVPYLALYMLSILLYLAPCGKQHIKKHLSRSMVTFSIVISYLCSLVLHIIYLTIRPPEKYPFLFEAMIMNFCFSHFLAFTVYTNAAQWMLSRQSTSRDKEKKLN
ncbi:hypothetical protein D5086_030934 [Populus alba]|uniref:Uncharacterized protein n=1 Tax=Populus alba TaxID=43335 RepID=A0ACC4APX6_POPAL